MPISLALQPKENQEIIQTYTFSKPSLTTIQIQDTTYDTIQTTNLVTVGDAGDPTLPAKLVHLLLPPQTTVENIYITTTSKQLIETNLNLNPISNPIPIKPGTKASIPQPNPAIYQTNQQFPGRLYTEIGTYIYRGYSIFILQLHPYQYNPVTGDLWYHPQLTVTIETQPTKEIPVTYRAQPEDVRIVTTKIDNPGLITTYENLPKQQTPREDYDLMILTTDTLKNAFIPLQQAHDIAGQPTIIQTLTDVGSTDLNDIRDFIKNAYLTMGVDYVLIGGDDNIVPAPILWVYGLDEGTTPYETYMPSDLFYACLDGPYNYDGDGKWGEPNDGTNGGDVDLYADVYVGRASVGNSAEATNFVDKTIAYLTKDPNDPYLAEVCLAGEYLGPYGIAQWGGNYLDQFIDGCSDDGYTTIGIPSGSYSITQLYDRDYPGNDWPKSEIISIINNDVHIINHLGHASYEYNLKMYPSDVTSLYNDKTCFIYSQGCMAGGFDNGDCMAEYFTVKTDSGAYAVIMNARYGWFWSYSTDGDSQRFHREYWDAVFGENIPEIGRANHDSKEDNLGIITRSCIRWVYYQTNLFGDPLLSFFEYQGNLPPNTPRIPTEKNGYQNTYTCNTTDPENDQIEYLWDWGDGTYSDWMGPYESGYTVEDTHYWLEPGTYYIRVKARDEVGKESPWSPSLEIEVTTGLIQITDITGGLFSIKATIQNTAPIQIDKIPWKIQINGGFMLSGIRTNSTISQIDAESTVQISSDMIFGLGLCDLVIEIPGTIETRSILIFGPLIALLE